VEIQVTADDTIVEDFKRVYTSQATKDVSFLIQGTEVKAHKAILIDQSTEFAALINNPDEGKEQKRTAGGQITLEKYPNVSAQAFESMLRLMYYSNEDFEMHHACQMYLFAREYNLVKLSLLIEKIVSCGEVSAITVLPLLDVAYNPLMAENPELQTRLKDNGMNYVIQNVDKIDFAPLQNMPALIGTQILQQLQQVLASNWRNMVPPASPHKTHSTTHTTSQHHLHLNHAGYDNIGGSGSPSTLSAWSVGTIKTEPADPKLLMKNNKTASTARSNKSKKDLLAGTSIPTSATLSSIPSTTQSKKKK